MSRSRTRNIKRPGKVNYLAIALSAIIPCACCFMLGIPTILKFISPTPTLPAKQPALSIEDMIAQTSAAAQTQTEQALPPTLIPTQTMAPQLEIQPTATVFIFELQTNMAATNSSVIIPYETSTPVLVTVPTDQPSNNAVCSCSGDTLNCSDFSTHASAQACFDYCMSQGMGDIHRLDQNNDGSACESLP